MPLKDVSGRPSELLREFGAEVSDLYRALANNERMLELWINMAWGLRTSAKTSRALRELTILRCAHVQGAAYQWSDHEAMAIAAGVNRKRIDAIPTWDRSELFQPEEMAALALTDEMLSGRVTDEALEVLKEHFEPEELIELIVTVGFYCMVPRVLDALRLAPESE